MSDLPKKRADLADISILLVFAATSVVFIPMVLTIVEFKQVLHRLFKAEFEEAINQQNFNITKISDLKVSVASAVLIHGIEKVFKLCFRDCLSKINKHKADPAAREVSVEKMTKKLFGTVFFTLMTGYGYQVLSQTEYLPTVLGGTATADQMMKLWDNYPVVSDPTYWVALQRYYLISFGYHIKSMYSLWSENRKAPRHDFLEMLLHHVVTILLYFYSYYTYIHKFGSLVMFLHDWADVSTCLIKLMYETHFKSINYVIAIAHTALWGYSRLIAFSWIIYYGLYLPPNELIANNLPTIEGGSEFAWMFSRMQHGSIFFLCVLLFLHVYWFSLFIKLIA